MEKVRNLPEQVFLFAILSQLEALGDPTLNQGLHFSLMSWTEILDLA